MISAFKREIQNHDIIHMNEYRTLQNAVAHYYAKKLKRPYVLTGHGTIPIMVEKFVTKKLFDEVWGDRILQGAAKLIASSSIEMKQFASAGVPSDKIIIVPNGIDVKSFESLPETGALKKKLGLGNSSVIVLYIGRLHKRKGIGFLLDAFAQMDSKNAVLVIAGADYGYLPKIKEKASLLQIDRKVVFMGYISERDKLAAYIDSSVVVYPGIYESFPLVPLEAALCSKPVIVSDDSVMAEIASLGGFGVATKYGDVTQLRNSLSTILNNSKMAVEMGRKGRDFVKINFNWPKIVSILEHVYCNVLMRN
jgi:glycosyltransferase involved in cell wall biosynthesis